jgi:hypothetical protein
VPIIFGDPMVGVVGGTVGPGVIHVLGEPAPAGDIDSTGVLDALPVACLTSAGRRSATRAEGSVEDATAKALGVVEA